MEFLNRHELQRRDAHFGQIRELARDIEKRAAFVRQVRREKGADVELIEDELMKRRRDIPAFVPRVSRLASLRARWLKSPSAYTARAFGAQTRKVAPSAIRLAPIGVLR